MAYADLASQLAGVVPGISAILAQTYVRQAWRDVRNERPWSFKTANGVVVCPPQIVAGTVSRTQYSTSLIFNTAATAALTPFITGTPPLTALSIRFTPATPIYRIMTVTSPSPSLTVTVDRPVSESTLATSTYSVYRCYVKAPVPDFRRWESFEDFANQRTLVGPRLTRLSIEFDRRDPGRTSAGPAQFLGSFVADPSLATVQGNNQVLYELWPHPVQGQTFLVTYKRNGPDFALPGDTQPDLFPDALLMTRALGWYGYPWAQANKARIPDLKATDFLTLIQLTRAQYVADLNAIRLQDEEISLQTVYNRGFYKGTRPRPVDPPLGDAAYWQNHPIYW